MPTLFQARDQPAMAPKGILNVMCSHTSGPIAVLKKRPHYPD